MANFDKAIQLILKNEGGYQAHPNDRGNYNSRGVLAGTKYGISAKTLERWRGYPVTATDMQDLSLTEAKEIYYKYYWLPIRANEIRDQDNAEIIFDHAVNAGNGRAAKLVQMALNRLGKPVAIDGQIGSQTLQALNTVDQYDFFNEFKDARLTYYSSISGGSNSVFARGWINRVLKFEKKKWS